MSTTFAALCAEVQSEIADTSSAMLTRIGGWVNEFHFQICSKRKWKWMEAVSDSILIKSTNYPFPISSLKVATVATPASKILDVLDVDYSPEFPLRETTVEAIRQSNQDYTTNTSGPPAYWYPYVQGYIKLFPNPDTTGRNYTFRFRKALSKFGAGATTAINIPDEWNHVLKNAATAKAFKWLDDSRSSDYFKEYQIGLENMEADDSNNNVILDRRPGNVKETRLPILSADS